MFLQIIFAGAEALQATTDGWHCLKAIVHRTTAKQHETIEALTNDSSKMVEVAMLLLRDSSHLKLPLFCV